MKISAGIFWYVGRYEASKLGTAGLRFRKWKVEIFDFLEQKNIFQVKSIRYKVTLLYQFLFLKELLAIENQTYSTKVKKSKNRPNSLYLHGVQGALVDCTGEIPFTPLLVYVINGRI